jgi:ATP-binding cassette subfamily F protein 3
VLQRYPGAVVVVSHDRAFLDRHANRIVELEMGQLTEYKGNYSEYVRQKAERSSQLAARRSTLDRQIAHVSRFIERFGAKATKATQARSRKKQLEKLVAERATLVEGPSRRGLKLRFPPAPRSGEIALRMEGVAKAYGENRVYESLDFELRRAERVALVGPNGAGQSTLLRMAAGALEPDAGTRELGHNAHSAFYAQHQLDALDASRSVYGEIEAGAQTEDVPRLRTLLGTFLFSGDDIEKRVAVLSGGEKARLALAKLLLLRANVLVLDEPTNHLDIQARDILTEALDQFTGTLLLISHDRHFIDALATRVVEVTRGPDGARLRSFAGNYSEYERRLEAEVSPEAAGPAETRRKSRRTAARDRERERAERRLREAASRAEEAIEATEREIEQLDWRAAEPEVARDGERMREISEKRAALQSSLHEHYQAWERAQLELERAADGDPRETLDAAR